jgi:predicted DsbA family dithiol-disulfide isomerase
LLAVKQLQLGEPSCGLIYIISYADKSAVAKFNMIHLHETLEVRYRFLPYQLNPHLTDDPLPRAEHLRRKFGDKKAAVIKELIEEKLKVIGYEV